MKPESSFERDGDLNTSKGSTKAERGRSFSVCMHVTNEYVFHVNCAHKAYCNSLGYTLHFFGHANMPTCNQ